MMNYKISVHNKFKTLFHKFLEIELNHVNIKCNLTFVPQDTEVFCFP